MIAWSKHSSDLTVYTTDFWVGQKGLLVTINSDPFIITLQRPGAKVGAELAVCVEATGNQAWECRVRGDPITVLQDQPTNYWYVSGTTVIMSFIAINADTWVIAPTNLANVA